MSALDENDCSYYHSPLTSLSTTCSIEMADSLERSLESHSEKLQRPKDHRSLFEYPHVQQTDIYSKTYCQVQNIIQELQSILRPVCVKDDCSIQSKPVVLRIPMKRNTLR